MADRMNEKFRSTIQAHRVANLFNNANKQHHTTELHDYVTEHVMFRVLSAKLSDYSSLRYSSTWSLT